MVQFHKLTMHQTRVFGMNKQSCETILRGYRFTECFLLSTTCYLTILAENNVCNKSVHVAISTTVVAISSITFTIAHKICYELTLSKISPLQFEQIPFRTSPSLMLLHVYSIGQSRFDWYNCNVRGLRSIYIPRLF